MAQTSPRRTFKAWSVGLVALGVVASATACAAGDTPESGASEGGPVTISFSWWGNDERALLTEEAIDVFEEQNPGVTVETTFSAIDAYIPKLATQIASGSQPDLFLIPMESVKEYTEKGATTDLTEYIGSEISIDDIPETNQRIGQIDGTFYGFTLGTATYGWAYDPIAFEEAGVDAPTAGFTWDDLIDAGEKIRAASGGAKAAITDPGGYIAHFSTWLVQNGKQTFTDEGGLGFKESDLEEWFDLMQELRDSGASTDPQTTSTLDQSMQNSGFALGKSAGEFIAASITGAFVDTIGAEHVALAPMPSDTDTLGMSMAGTNVAAVSPESDHPDVAAKLLNFLINDPEAAEILGLTRGIPLNSVNYEALAPTLTGGDKLVNDFVLEYQADFSDPSPLAPPGVSTLPADFTLAYENVIFGQQSNADAAKALYATFEAAIS
ncbi:MAG TPA: extracellular solute-binding protein [Microbacterium sp.]|jgi:multiple sugar transport system substrate-binding protein|nr:extracellular solute-binding protein [Microbacterium sp.]